jgi:hypothetical protein
MKNTRKNLKEVAEVAEVEVTGVNADMKRNDLIKLMSSFLGKLGQAGVQGSELISAWKAWTDSDIQKFVKPTSKPSTSMSLSELRSIVREEILKEMEMSPKQSSVTTLQKNLRTIGSKPMSGVSGGEAANAEQLITSILHQIQTSKQDMTTVLKHLTQKLSQLTSQK